MIPVDGLNEDGFRAALPQQDPNGWLLGEASGECHSHASLKRIEPHELVRVEDGEEVHPPNPFFSIEVSTYRSGLAEDEAESDAVSHADFFTTAQQFITAEELEITASTTLYFSADSSRWRISLLANPPEFGEFTSDLGRLSLGGLTLRFDDSKVGLYEAELEVSPFRDEYRIATTFVVKAHRDTLPQIYETVVKRAEEFSLLFIRGSDVA